MGQYKFKHIVAAGSWDHFHKGHQLFLNQAFGQALKVSVGITNDEMVTVKAYAQSRQSYKIRHEAVVDFLKEKGFFNRAKIFKLDDIYGPAISDPSYDALLMTSKTRKGAEAVNLKREARGFKALALVPVSLSLANDKREISSERIRAGEINRQGLVYLSPFSKTPVFYLPKELREDFKKPFGTLIEGWGKQAVGKIRKFLKEIPVAMVICVGDVVTKLALDFGLNAGLYIVDFKVERNEKYTSLTELGFKPEVKAAKVQNSAGAVTAKLAKEIKSRVDGYLRSKKFQVIQVEGEEDLAVIPAILAAPLNSVILYGQPKQGVVISKVTEENKQKIFSLLSKFKT